MVLTLKRKCAVVLLSILMLASTLSIAPFAGSTNVPDETNDPDGFDWLLTEGYNLVSCPMEATYRVGSNPYFDTEDALDWTNIYLFNNYGVMDPGLSIIDRTGGNPSSYNCYDVGTGEAPAFPIDTVHGYWVYLSLPGPYTIHFDAVNASTTSGDMVDVALEAGWNLMGFQHNHSNWATIPTASMFTDGTIDPNLRHTSFGGFLNKIVVTQWTQGKWYNSYVVEDGFPGMPGRNWTWDFSYSSMPGNGFFLWVDQAITLSYSTVFSGEPGNGEYKTKGRPSPIIEDDENLVADCDNTDSILHPDNTIPERNIGIPEKPTGLTRSPGPPEITASTTSGSVHDGDHTNEQITLTGTVSDLIDLDTIIACEIQITSPSAITYGPYAMTMTSAGGSAIESFEFTWDFPNGIPEGLYSYQMRGCDDADGWNMTWDTNGYTFTITDTTPPTVAYNPLSPLDGAGRSLGTPVNIYIDYVDFTEVDITIPLASTLYYWNPLQGEAFRANSVILQNESFFFGSFNHRLMETITMYGAIGDTIFYDAEVYDSSAGGPIMVPTAQRSLVIPGGIFVSDPYPIYGYSQQYDGTSVGGYAPSLIPGASVDVTWWNGMTGWNTIATTSNANAQFSADLLDHSDFDHIYCNATSNPVWGNLGYNWTQIEIVGAPGGRRQDVVCGVPYDVNITVPVSPPIPIIQTASIFPVTYEIIDRDGLIAPGYYTYNALDPDRGFINITAGIFPPSVPPYSYSTDPDQTFDGTLSATPGTYTANMQIFFPKGLWYINVSEGGQAFPDSSYLTPWGEWYLDPTYTIKGWQHDWDNITINILGGGSFDWLLSPGWNLVSCPRVCSFRIGANPFFDSQDALSWVNNYLLSNFGVIDPNLIMQNRTGGNPSTYETYYVDTGEASAFAIDTIHGYWVYMSIAGSYVINFDSFDASTSGVNTQDVPIQAGWNLLGFQHNFTIWWDVWPTASMFTDSTVDLSGFMWHADLGGARTKIVATQWGITKSYESYVVDIGFPGMSSHNWVWNPTLYSANPGDGLWLWSDAAGMITYSTLFDEDPGSGISKSDAPDTENAILSNANILPNDPYPIYGYVLDDFVVVPGASVTVEWVNATGIVKTIGPITTNVNGQYCVDIFDYDSSSTIWVNASYSGKNGYNVSSVIIPSMGGEWMDVFLELPLPTFNIELNDGWNLISLPLMPTNTTIESVLSSIDGYWDVAQYYDANENDHWKSYATFKPSNLNDFWNIDSRMAFWIHIFNGPVNLTNQGSEQNSTTIPLYAGWNMVGYPTQTNETVANALWGTGADSVMICNVSEPYNIQEVGPDYVMHAGEGYWVHVVADSVWTVDW